MSCAAIIDAHMHVGQPGVFFAPETTLDHILYRMDQLNISSAICTDNQSLTNVSMESMAELRSNFERSGSRIHYLAVYDPRRANECIEMIRECQDWAGLAGIKIHPSFHGVSAEDESYDGIWQFASKNSLPILSHTWSSSDYNPIQRLSTPERFERYLKTYGDVKFVLGHAGGRGAGRHDAVRIVNEYPNAYLDFAGDVFCHSLIESLVDSVPVEKILFGTDFPWIDPRANLSRVLLADIPTSAKQYILHENALSVYDLRCD